jgi:hypothetical protein
VIGRIGSCHGQRSETGTDTAMESRDIHTIRPMNRDNQSGRVMYDTIANLEFTSLVL